jgi:hypothetical protein
VRAAVLVEGNSDRVAVETLAARRGRDLESKGVAVIPMGGAGNIRSAVARYGPEGLGVRLAGLYDAGEEQWFRRALEDAGFGSGLGRSELERLGFFVCVEDLEDELIRALGAPASKRSSPRKASSAPSARSRSSRRSEGGRPRRSCGASSGRTAGARRTTRGRSSRRSTSSGYQPRSTASSPT